MPMMPDEQCTLDRSRCVFNLLDENILFHPHPTKSISSRQNEKLAENLCGNVNSGA